MRMLKESACALALLGGMAAVGNAQIPAVPSAGAAPAAAVPGATTAAAPAAPSNIWSFLCPTADQKAACKAKICNSSIGQLMNNSLLPVGALTGGLIGPFCPPVSQAALNMPPTSAEGAAAQIKKDEADAKARRAAIRYLGTVDCHYWPEAQEALIKGLRADRNECVRLEAALALGHGCCCTKATIVALSICVEGSNRDGNPSENSPRVVCAAEAALDHCLANFTEVTTPPEIKRREETEPRENKEQPPVLNKTTVNPVDFYKRVVDMPWPTLIAEARRAASKAHAHVQPPASPVAGGHSLVEIVGGAFSRPATSGVYSPPLAPDALATTKPAPMTAPDGSVVAHTPPPPPAPLPQTVVPVPAGVPEAPVPAPTVPLKSVPVTPSTSSPQTNVVLPPTPMETVPMSSSPYAHPNVPVAVVPPANTPLADPFQTPASPYTPMPMVPPVTAAVPPPAPLPTPGGTILPTTPTSGDPAVASLREVVMHAANPTERVGALGQLARCDIHQDPQVLPTVLAASDDSDPRVRVACLHALKEFKVWSPEVVRVVRELAFDKDANVRFEAMCILDHLGGGVPSSPVSTNVPVH